MLDKFFLFFLFLLPIQTVYFLREPFIGGVKWEYGVVALYGTDILLLLIFALVLFRTIKERIWNQESGIKIPPLGDSVGMTTLMLLLFIVWTGASIFWAGDQMLALYFFVKLLFAGGLFFVVRGMEIDMKKVVFVLLAAGVIQSGIGIMQFVSQQSISSSLLGMSMHEVSQAGTSVLKIDHERWLRAYGTFPHPNILGGFLGMILVLVMGFLSLHPSFLGRGQGEVLKEDHNPSSILPLERGGGVLFLVGTIIILLGLILTFSRVAWFGVVMGIGMIVYQKSKIKDQKSFTLYQIFGTLSVAVAVFGIILHEQIFPRFDRATIEREGSVSERVVSLQDARTLIGEHSLIGVGAGNFTAEIIKQEPDRPVWSIQPTHNVFLLVWSELGIVGLMLLIGFLVSALLPILKSLPALLEGKIKNHQSAILIAIIPSLLLDHWLWTSHFGLLFFFLLLALVSRKPLTE